MYLNRVMLIGRVGRKPEVRYVKEDTPVASFSLATTEPYKTKEGERKELTEWHNIIGWRQLAKFCETYIDKGMLVYVEGRLQTRSWTGQDNQTHYTTEILADIIRMLESKQSRERNGGNVQSAPVPAAQSFTQTAPESTNIINQVAADSGFTPVSNQQSFTPEEQPFGGEDDLPF